MPLVLLSLLASGCAQSVARRDTEHGRRSRRVSFAHAPSRFARPELADPARCYQALTAAGVAFEPVPAESAAGIAVPTRLRGPLGGIEVVPSDHSVKHALLDCRLALALLAWAPTLRRAGVDRIEHYSTYRPGSHVRRTGKISGHSRGLAIDAARFGLDDGEVLDVRTDWQDRERGGAPCPRRPDEGRSSRLLRGVVCAAVQDELFQVVITPHHDHAHADHVHLELRPEVSWIYVR